MRSVTGNSPRRARNALLVLFAGIAGVAFSAAIVTDARNRRLARARLKDKEAVRTWENEGGNVPEVSTVNPPAPPGAN
ncbi:MAG TPA: hypothetical protein VHB46_11520 [Burkholderiales bacterium]|nr:hypothetical protein [Burkholderiales bacterium]